MKAVVLSLFTLTVVIAHIAAWAGLPHTQKVGSGFFAVLRIDQYIPVVTACRY
jgi:hypothetical protein